MSQALSAAGLLDLWERCQGQPAGLRALTLLAGCTGASPDAVARLTVGQRDRALGTVRRVLFGSRIRSRADCPACGTQLELELELDDLTTEPVPPPDPVLQQGEVRITWRLP